MAMEVSMKIRNSIKSRVLLSMFMVVLLIQVFQPMNVYATNGAPNVDSYGYVVMDANSGNIILSKNKDKTLYPASSVKLMTAIVAIENADNLDMKITAKESVLSKVANDASKIGLKSGYSYSLNELLHMLLIVSAADAADTIAEGVCGSVGTFVKEMNEKAQELNLYSTSFDNTIGLDIGNNYNKTYTTASDFAIVARYAMTIPLIRDIVAKHSYTLNENTNLKGRVLNNTNRFYTYVDYNKNLYTIIGSKTGTTNAAGSVLIATAIDKEGHEVICAFFGNKGRDCMYQDIRALFDYVFEGVSNKTITLSKGFYDTRFLDSAGVILECYEKGIVCGKTDGSFGVKDTVNQLTFVETVNKISGENLKPIAKNKNMTIKDFAQILYQEYPNEIPSKKIQKIEEKVVSSTELTKEEMKQISNLYYSSVLYRKYSYQVDANLTREDMIMIGYRLAQYTSKLKAAS